ncbi:MAG: GGDEF domain-containing response regulator [Desulfobacteraceae bacterium]|nr:GGDEF domain-containing response regulator [Desulfobacteraceae bacterium]
MKMNKNQLLVIASDASAHTISKAMTNIFGLEMIRSYSDTEAIELIITTTFVGILLEDDLSNITPLKIAARLSSHENSKVTPLMFITNSLTSMDPLISFPSLLMDFIAKPLEPGILEAKIKIFFELYKNKTAVAQSISELDRIYEKIIDFQRISFKEQDLRKKITNFSSAFTNQMHSPLKEIQAGIYQLQKSLDLSPQSGQAINHIRNATQQITNITKKASSLMRIAPRRLAHLIDDTGAQRPCYILYVNGSKDEFEILRHYIKGALDCVLHQASTIAQAKKIISAQNLDILFINHRLSDGTGFDLLSDLNRLKSDVPIIFTMDSSQNKLGAKAIVQGADNFFIKEKISTRNILAILWETLEKSRLTKEIKGARKRITLISIQDHLTCLYNRQYFDRTLKIEIDRALRYQLPLSILIIDFDKFKSLNQTHGYEIGDQILKTSAVLVQSMARNIDIVCRYESDQFTIVLPNTDQQGAKILAQRILEGIRRYGFETAGKAFYLTVSIGLATCRDAPSPYQDLIKEATKALDLAVQQGGNTIRHLPETKNSSSRY